MKCPSCQAEFKYSWKNYWIASFSMNRFKTLCCNSKVKLKSSWYYIVLASSVSFIATISAMYFLLNDFSYLIKIVAFIPVTILLVADKIYDSKRKLESR